MVQTFSLVLSLLRLQHANDTGQQDGNHEAEQESCSCVHEAEPPDSQKPFEVKHFEGTA